MSHRMSAMQPQYVEPYAQKRFPEHRADSHSNSGSYGSTGRQQTRDPYSPHLSGSQQGSYRVNNNNNPNPLVHDSYRQDTLTRDRSDPYARAGTLTRDNRLSNPPSLRSDQRSTSPSSSVQYSTTGAPTSGSNAGYNYNRGYAAPTNGQAPPPSHQQPYRQTPQSEHRGLAPNDPRRVAPDQRSISSDRYSSAPRDVGYTAGGVAPPRKRTPDEGYGTMDNLGQGQGPGPGGQTLDNRRAPPAGGVGYNNNPHRAQSEPRDPRMMSQQSQASYGQHQRQPPPSHVPQQHQPPLSNDPYGRAADRYNSNTLLRDKGSADPRNMNSRYPRDSNTDLYSERSIDVGRGERGRDDDSVSDDGGFRSRRPDQGQGQQGQWTSPYDIRYMIRLALALCVACMLMW